MNAYPIFRLVMFLAAGIFCADTFRMDWGLYPVAGLLFLLLVLGALRKSLAYGSRWLFGGMVSCFMFLVGWVLTSCAWKEVLVDWSSERQGYSGVLQESPVEKARSYECRLAVAGKDVLLYLPKDSLSASLKMTDEIYFYANVRSPQAEGDSSHIGYATYLCRQGISGTAYAPAHAWRKSGREAVPTLKQRALLFRERMLENYRHWGIGDEQMPVLAALTLGYKGELDRQTREAYSDAGISHVLALSGMHVGILWMLLAAVGRLLLRERCRWLQGILVVTVLWTFAFVVGLEASVVRAVVMCMLMELGRLGGSRPLSMNTLAVAAFFMLLYRPFYLFDVSFQLSFVAVASILILFPLLFRSIVIKNRLVRWFWGVTSVSVAAQLGTAPLVMYYFSNFSVYFLLANWLAAVLVPIIIYICLLMVLLAPLLEMQAWAVTGLNGLVSVLNGMAGWTAGLPGATFSLSVLKPVELVMFYVVLLCGVMYVKNRRRKWLIRGLAACVCLLAFHLYVLLGG